MGNLGFHYAADGIEYSDDTVHLGTHRAGADDLAGLENGPVTIAVTS